MHFSLAWRAVLHQDEAGAVLCDGGRGDAGRMSAVETVRKHDSTKGAHKLTDVRRVSPTVLLLGLLVIGQVTWSSPASAWTLEGHRLIALDALSVLPPQMREALTPHLSPLLAGVEEPDFFRVVSHKIPLISLRGTPPPPRSGAPDALKQFASNAQEMLRLGRDLWGVLFVVGQATHFVQDLNQPLHAGWGETRAEHNAIEAKMRYRSWQKEHARLLRHRI